MFVAYDKENVPTFIDHAVPGEDYFCPVCKAKMSARRGEFRQHYFAHYPGEACTDSWDRQYEMSEWHRNWQALFPVKNQEVVVQLGDVKHRADVLIGKTVIEFQHSPMSADTFNDRNSFYHNLGYKVVWVFDFIEEFNNGQITKDDNGDCHWINPKVTFNKRNIQEGQVDLFFQFNDMDNQSCLVKVLENEENRFDNFAVGAYLSKQDFLDIFLCNGLYPLPFSALEVENSDYVEFKQKYNVVLDKQQEKAVQTIEGANLILAVPGSGKTTVLITRIAYMVKCRHIDGRSILALTYSKNAVADMNDRYIKKFGSEDCV